jgi:hypothetical protein
MFVLVEGTKTCIVPAGMTQFDARLGSQIYNIYLGFDLVNDGHSRDYRLDWTESQIDDQHPFAANVWRLWTPSPDNKQKWAVHGLPIPKIW